MSRGLVGMAYTLSLSEGAALGFPELVAVTPHPTRALCSQPQRGVLADWSPRLE